MTLPSQDKGINEPRNSAEARLEERGKEPAGHPGAGYVLSLNWLEAAVVASRAQLLPP